MALHAELGSVGKVRMDSGQGSEEKMMCGVAVTAFSGAGKRTKASLADPPSDLIIFRVSCHQTLGSMTE
ncbi:hypothetical protein RvY_00955 [Ramazzottius varieornatus]|uniref:Uncharacterized protein n=1 Tax=Ramazzottius varieornatus TaxID=947166 RepID=A0A1D1UIL7_RAMVA|nr:hypothetical protein RvY_00955 [Ramazzottius varieornatus]